jgi:hypothetical protein
MENNTLEDLDALDKIVYINENKKKVMSIKEFNKKIKFSEDSTFYERTLECLDKLRNNII